MSAFANITVFDGASTPVSHTLQAISISRVSAKIIATWRELQTTVPTEAQISLTMSVEALKSGVTVSTMDAQVPVMESISGQNAAGYTAAPKVAYIDRQVITNYGHPRSTVGGRRLLRQMSINLQGNVSTSVTTVNTGAWPECCDLQVTPT
jgi:hypothetical protein